MKTTIKKTAAGTFIALLLMVVNIKANGTELKALSQKTFETTLQLQKWMTDDMIWNTNFINIEEFFLETEPGIELESWMTNAEMWNFNGIFVEETETAIELEDWMTRDETWNTLNNDVETELTVENWMVNDSIWE